MSDVSELITDGGDATDGSATGGSPPPASPRTSSNRGPFDFSLKLDLQAPSLRDRVRSRVENSVGQSMELNITPVASTPRERTSPEMSGVADAVAAAVAAASPLIIADWASGPTPLIEPFVDEPVPEEISIVAFDISAIPEMVPVDAQMPATVVTPDTRDSSFVSRAAMPVLPKPAVRLATDEQKVEARVAPGPRLAPQPPVVTRVGPGRTKHRFVKVSLVLIIVLGLLGGGGYVLLMKRSASQAKVWPAELAPMATFVESTLGHTFKQAVPVRALPQAEYEAKLGIYLLERVPSDSSGGFSGLRALGLIDSDPSAADVGQFAAATRTAFYDPTTRTIYHPPNADDAESDAGVLASMSAALYDQYKNWGEALPTMSPSQQIGYLSMIEGLGTYVVREKKLDTAFATAYATAHSARVARQASLGSQLSPWIVGLVEMHTPTALGLLTRALDGLSFETLNAPSSDAAVLDSARGFQTPVAVPTAELSTVGMYFWYGVLYPALGSDDAFRLASAWSGDSVTYTSTSGRGCIRASVATRDAASLAALVGGLNTWALTRSASSSTTVASRGTVAVVNACEPVETTPLDLTSLVGVDFHARLATEQVLLQQLSRLSMPLTAPTIACAVNSYRTDGLVGLEDAFVSLSVSTEAEISAELRRSLQDLATFCSSAR